MPGPTYTRPHSVDTGETGRRAEFEHLLVDRCEAIGRTGAHAEVMLLAAIAGEFVDAVELVNSSNAILRVGEPFDYVDAVLVEGTSGRTVVTLDEYEANPVAVHAKVGEVERILLGSDLDAYLRTGEQRYATRLGLA